MKYDKVKHYTHTHTSTAHVYTYHTDLGTNGELVRSTLPLNEKSTIRNVLDSRFLIIVFLFLFSTIGERLRCPYEYSYDLHTHLIKNIVP